MIEEVKEVGIKVKMVVSIEGKNVEIGKKIIKERGMKVI